jgi:hypothetical protein
MIGLLLVLLGSNKLPCKVCACSRNCSRKVKAEAEARVRIGVCDLDGTWCWCGRSWVTGLYSVRDNVSNLVIFYLYLYHKVSNRVHGSK